MDAVDFAALPDPKQGRAWWRELNRYHWFVLVVAVLGWLFDTMDQQLFTQARTPALTQLLHVAPSDPAVKNWGGIATMVFMWGWATGGVIFGILGDRIGRARTMVTTIICYSAFTGLSALSVGPWDFCLYRFLTGVGVGGEFAVGVALVAEVMPERARTHALGWIQALSAIGNISAAVIAMGLGQLETLGVVTTPWRIMFLIGVFPAILAVLVMRRLREPERWKAAAMERGQHKLGSLRELFGEPRWRRNAIVGLCLATAGVVGLWGTGFFSPELIRAVLREGYEKEQLPSTVVEGRLTFWVGMALLVQNTGSFFGIHVFAWFARRSGRRPAFAVGFVLALASTALTFWFLSGHLGIFFLVPLMGFCQLALFGGYAIYFPELFPTRLRSTGTSFCYNIGRYIASIGPLTLNLLASEVYGGFGNLMSYRLAGLTMCTVFLLGLVALPFAPETRGQPLPD
jgi:MFS family permease